MDGNVASPTPTVPISSDSTSTISSSSPNCCDSAAAVTQPAVPPPVITTFLTAGASKRTSSTIQTTEQEGAQTSRLDFIHGPEVASSVFGKMFACGIAGPEYVIVEDFPPGAFFDLGSVAQAEQRVQQCVVR